MLLANWGLYEKENELQSSTIGTLEAIESNFGGMHKVSMRSRLPSAGQ